MNPSERFPQVAPFLYGIKPALLAVVFAVLWRLGKTAVKGWPLIGVGLAVALPSGPADHPVKRWDAAPGEELCTPRGHTDGVNRVAFSPDGRTLASGSEDGTVRLWGVAR